MLSSFLILGAVGVQLCSGASVLDPPSIIPASVHHPSFICTTHGPDLSTLGHIEHHSWIPAVFNDLVLVLLLIHYLLCAISYWHLDQGISKQTLTDIWRRLSDCAVGFSRINN